MFLDIETQKAKNSETAKTPLKQSIIDLEAQEARKYFLNPQNYLSTPRIREPLFEKV